MNLVVIVGRLTRDPEVRYTATGKAVASFSVAVDSGYGDNKKVDFIPVTVWDKLAEICGNNLTKGHKVLVEGRLQIRDYEKDGQKKRSTDVLASNVEFLENKQHLPQQPTTNEPSPADSMGTEIDSELGF